MHKYKIYHKYQLINLFLNINLPLIIYSKINAKNMQSYALNKCLMGHRHKFDDAAFLLK